MKKPLIPFKWLPASWGLKGKTREIAQAEYELSGYALDLKMAEINHRDNPTALKLDLLEIEANHGRIDDYEYDCQRTALEHPDPESIAYKLAKLEVEFHHEKIGENEYKKSVANLKNEPYINIVNHGFDPSKGIEGVYFEFDWNRQWIELLHAHKYVGASEEHMVQQWYDDVCASVRDAPQEPIPMSGRRVVRPGPDGGPTEYY